MVIKSWVIWVYLAHRRPELHISLALTNTKGLSRPLLAARSRHSNNIRTWQLTAWQPQEDRWLLNSRYINHKNILFYSCDWREKGGMSRSSQEAVPQFRHRIPNKYRGHPVQPPSQHLYYFPPRQLDSLSLCVVSDGILSSWQKNCSWWILWINLAGSWCSDMWSDIILDVSVRVFEN